MSAIITDLFRVFNAKQFVESLSEPSTSSPAAAAAAEAGTERTRLYFFIGRPNEWNSYLEYYAQDVSLSSFQVGEQVYQGSTLPTATAKGTIVKIYPQSLLLSNVTGTFASGVTIKGNTSAGQAKAGIFRVGSDSSPIVPFDNLEEKFEVYDDMTALKRVTNDDIVHVVSRYNWSSQTYDMYKPDYSSAKLSGATQKSSLYESKFYVMNSQYQVFKCLYNGETPTDVNGVVSIEEPVKTASGPDIFIETYDPVTRRRPSDSKRPYIWRYMFTIPTSSVLKFVSTDFIPIVTGGTTSVNGEINVALITSVGSGYDNGTYYQEIRGNGSGAIVKLVVENNQLSTIDVVSGGSGYTYGAVDISSTSVWYSTLTGQSLSGQVSIDANSNATNGAIDVIISPQGGHGSDPILELGGKRVMINTRLEYAEGSGDFVTDNDFRRIGLLTDPKLRGTSTFATSSTLSSLGGIKIKVPGGDYQVDEEITQTYTVGGVTYTAKGTVVSWTPYVNSSTGVIDYGILKYIQSPQKHTDNSGQVRAFVNDQQNVVGSSSLIAALPDNTVATTVYYGMTFTDGIAQPEIEKYSGEIIYVENRRPITRAQDQIEDIKLVVEF